MNNSKLSEKEIISLNKNGPDTEDINKQIDRLSRGNIPVSLIRPATIDDGIIRFSKERRLELSEKFDEISSDITIAKFIPSSGAATRMFSKLAENLKNLTLKNATPEELLEDENRDKSFTGFFNAVKKRELPFYDYLEIAVKNDGFDLDNLVSENSIEIILEYILGEKGLNYGSLPKALVKFHKYKDMAVSPIGEHFIESVLYTVNPGNITNIHFTIPEEYRDKFAKEVHDLKEFFKQKGYEIITKFSVQDLRTNTISITKAGEPVRDNNGDLVLRAGGHGSLISNLNELSEDIIFIKNIDNVTTGDRLNDTIINKKLLGAYLIEVRNKIFSSLRTLPRIIKDGESINEIYCFAKDVLNISFPPDFIDFDLEKKRRILTDKLNRPIRVCGMVKNMNEPGGGPFWIEDKNGEVTLQIIEMSQLDNNSAEQSEIFTHSSHFNPVDIVCSIKDYRGNIFSLNDFVEESRYFVSEKQYNNGKILVIEHPGLWNGSMEKWISLFIEVPLTTFNPVKYVHDLFQDNHKPSEGTLFSDLI